MAKLIDVAQRPDTHGYSSSKVSRVATRHFPLVPGSVPAEIDPDSEAVVTIGSKEGLAHLMLATLDRGDTVVVPIRATPSISMGPSSLGLISAPSRSHRKSISLPNWSAPFEAVIQNLK